MGMHGKCGLSQDAEDVAAPAPSHCQKPRRIPEQRGYSASHERLLSRVRSQSCLNMGPSQWCCCPEMKMAFRRIHLPAHVHGEGERKQDRVEHKYGACLRFTMRPRICVAACTVQQYTTRAANLKTNLWALLMRHSPSAPRARHTAVACPASQVSTDGA
ncbi:hypothetical protein T440DRAFT_169362 [Plenodomus tracheiphilus IPT5]|uniref:Uncharacterized protein n=1 Tax=Plenodomus tracheiphilus IPT5 TaxID=1408161 RepID=A0A6A7AZT0_9PLEO|nr:hypothetical protein T440DRAFT_169362 [Plenodomus tracheiphilus IPT5]